MTVHTESNVQVDLSEKLYFRFQDLEAYRSLKGQHLKEMDFCWLENGKLIMLELKAYSEEVAEARQENTTPDKFIMHLIHKIFPKVCDSLLMLSACWLPTHKGEAFRRELDSPFHTRTKRIGVVIVVDVPVWFKPHFHILKERFREVLRGRMALFDSRSLIVCMPSQLEKTPFSACLKQNGIR